MAESVRAAAFGMTVKVNGVELVKEWHCPSCHLEHRSQGPEVAMHNCPSLNGLLVPLVLEGADAIHRVNYREDYQGTDICSARDDDGGIVMSVSLEYADGSNALNVYVPCATIDFRDKEMADEDDEPVEMLDWLSEVRPRNRAERRRMQRSQKQGE